LKRKEETLALQNEDVFLKGIWIVLVF
jgi:hypothetical protein